ncbi:hypothetical protein BGZ65_002388 [Modicella reniformis]|uniref:Uncharacterized protein n=1 Tax=Modicella reniformis TaxID=1440133 RepID=A0A9P6M9N9_9FUNG|nr:hypothetical protein BGZ65_002388 [Modicella reniformis]
MIPSFTQRAPSGVIENDRHAHITEDQRETMKHAAEEARKRREEEERVIEEGKARARAKADELARKAEEANRAKETVATSKEPAAKEVEQTTTNVEDSTSTSSKSSSSAAVKSSRDPGDQRHIKVLTESEKREARALWRALPERLMAEHAENRARNIEEYKKAEQERQARKAAAVAQSIPLEINKEGNTKSTEHANEPKTAVAAEVPNNSEPQKETESTDPMPSGSNTPVPLTNPQSDETACTRNVNDERPTSPQLSTSLSPPQATRDESEDQGVKADLTADVAQTSQSHGQMDKPAPKERTRNGKVGRERSHADSAASWRKTEFKSEGLPESKTAAAPSNGTIKMHNTQGRVKDGQAPGKSEKIERDSYPAKLKGVNGSRKISQITKIHARLALNAAGNTALGNSHEPPVTASTPHAMTNRLAESPTVKEKGIKRQSLLNATTPIFPSMVESAAKKRGSMSFMVESEVKEPATEQKPLAQPLEESAPSSEDIQPAVMPQWEDSKALSHLEQSQGKDGSVDDGAKRAWESASVTSITSKQEDVHHPGLAQGVAMPGMILVNGTGPGVPNPMSPQPMWNGSIAVDSTSQAGTTITPPYPMMMPFYPQGFPVGAHRMIYMYPGGPIPGHLAQFPGGVVPAHGSMPHTSRDVHAGPAATLGSPEMTNASGDMTLDGTLGNPASVANSTALI